MLALFAALISGLGMAVQGALNAALSKKIGLLGTTLVVHVIGTLTTGILFLLPQVQKGRIMSITRTPWHLSLGGLLSVPIVYGVAVSIKTIGAAPATTLIVVAQVLMACIVDHFGLFGLQAIPFYWWRYLGIAFLAFGSWLLLRGR
jgi:transporter family-2 protein